MAIQEITESIVIALARTAQKLQTAKPCHGWWSGFELCGE